MRTEADVDPQRRTAVIVGGLFIVALVLHLVGGMIYGQATGSEDFLESAYPDRRTVTLGVLVEFVAVLAIPMIGFFMFPVLKRFNEALALAYVGFRSLEAVFLIAIQTKVLALIDLSEDHQGTDGVDGLSLQAIGDSLLAENDRIFVLYVLVFGLGALIFYGMLIRTRLVPRWLAIWGFAAAAWMMAGTVLIMFDAFSATSATAEIIIVIAVPLNELALAFWLIFKGFDDRSAVTSNEAERLAVPVEAS
ncbi:MAG: DUF4386 domain-containing protein [Acidimicrobiales bacterium]